MTKPPSQNRFLSGILSSVLVFLALGATSLFGEEAFVTSYLGGTIVACPPFCQTGNFSSSGTSTVSTAIPAPPARTRAKFGGAASGNTGCTFSVQPTLATTGGGYRVWATWGPNNASADLLARITLPGTDGTLADTNYVVQASIDTTAFQAAKGQNIWVPLCVITNSTTTPTLTFTYVSGTLNSTSGRWYWDAIRFQSLDPCSGMTGPVGVDGPLAAGQTFVNVTGITGGATNVTIYANGSPIGGTNFAGGFAAGNLQVPGLPGLILNDQITATQIRSNCVSTLAASGPPVGGGANPSIRLSLGLCSNTVPVTGPIGVNGNNAGVLYLLKATSLIGGSATAANGGEVLTADQCWHTVTFSPTDSTLQWLAGGTVAQPAYASLDSLAFAINETDSGPYDIYVDQIKNGDTVIEDFEGAATGSSQTIAAPSAATTPSPGATYLSNPNSSTVSTNYAFDGTNSCRIQWQFIQTSSSRWARVLLSGPTHVYPQIDTTKSVTMRVLVLPVGTTVAHAFNGVVSNITAALPVSYTTSSNTLSVGVSGPGPYTYQWDFGGPLTDATNASLKIGDQFGLSGGNSGVYSVTVSDGTCNEIRKFTVTVVDPLVSITNNPAKTIIHVGETATTMHANGDGHVDSGYPLTYQWNLFGNPVSGATDSTLTLPAPATIADAGDYTCTIGNPYGFTNTLIAQLDVIPIGADQGSGTGLRGNYWSMHTNGVLGFVGAPTLVRTDTNVNMNFGAGSPDPSISADYFTARWVGQVQALGTDSYQFHTVTDDGVRLWVNGSLLIDNWTLHGATTNSGAINLTGTNKYDIIMEYFENAVSATAQLLWSNATGVAYEVIPPSQLYPATASGPTVTLVSPSVNSTSTAPASATLTATVVTNISVVSSVGFYTNGVLLTTVPAAPFTYSWTGIPAGTYTVNARVTYNGGASAGDIVDSASVFVVAVNATPPNISGITSDGLGSVHIAGTGATGQEFVLYKGTNVSQSLSLWTPVSTNSVGNGTFNFPVSIGSTPAAFFKVLSR